MSALFACVVCGTPVEVRVSRFGRVFCSDACYGRDMKPIPVIIKPTRVEPVAPELPKEPETLYEQIEREMNELHDIMSGLPHR
jgi:hypothetical protein